MKKTIVISLILLVSFNLFAIDVKFYKGEDLLNKIEEKNSFYFVITSTSLEDIEKASDTIMRNTNYKPQGGIVITERTNSRAVKTDNFYNYAQTFIIE